MFEGDEKLWEAWLRLTEGTGLTISQRGRAFLSLMACVDDRYKSVAPKAARRQVVAV
ncbi:hypothetical protein [Streptomyces deccanensis]|uniref:hypothetical protein n=1 Tax=Streptomyces deccanensis TaxID=424188 RepID=UPI001EFAD6ED|nr:hypothetical protein [Streptomyces deccanensis]ULR51018.1 hypothetical protein L3078_17890 [Streptomyces deccanensis]